jgi:hypothetical protein
VGLLGVVAVSIALFVRYSKKVKKEPVIVEQQKIERVSVKKEACVRCGLSREMLQTKQLVSKVSCIQNPNTGKPYAMHLWELYVVPWKQEALNDFVLKYADSGEELDISNLRGKWLSVDNGDQILQLAQHNGDLKKLLQGAKGLAAGDHPARLFSGDKSHSVILTSKENILPRDRRVQRFKEEAVRQKRELKKVQVILQEEALSARAQRAVEELIDRNAVQDLEVEAQEALSKGPEAHAEFVRGVASIHQERQRLSYVDEVALVRSLQREAEESLEDLESTLTPELEAELTLSMEQNRLMQNESFMAIDEGTRFLAYARAGNQTLGSCSRVGNCLNMPWHYVELLDRAETQMLIISGGGDGKGFSFIIPKEVTKPWSEMFVKLSMIDQGALPLPIQAAPWPAMRVAVPDEGVQKMKFFVRHPVTGKCGMDTVEATVRDGVVLYKTDHAAGFCGSVLMTDGPIHGQGARVVAHHVQGMVKSPLCKGAAWTEAALREIQELSKLSPIYTANAGILGF